MVIQKNFKLAGLLGFNFLVWASLGVLAPIEALFLDSLTTASSVKGIIMAIPSLMLLLFSPVIIEVSRRYGKKRILLGLTLFSLPFIALLPYSPSVPTYAFLKFLASFIFLTQPVLFAYVPAIARRLGLSYGSIILASSLGGSFGTMVSGLVGQRLGLTWSYLVLVALALLSLLFLFPLEEVRIKSVRTRARRGVDIVVLAVLVNTFLFSLHLSARSIIWPEVFRQLTSNPAIFTGFTFSMMGLIAALLSIPAGLLSDRLGHGKVFLLGWLLMGIFGVLLFPASFGLYLFMVVSNLYAVGEVLKGPSGSAILAKYGDVFFGYQASLGAFGGLIGSIMAGFLVDFLGPGMAILALGILVLVPLLPFLAWARKFNKA